MKWFEQERTMCYADEQVTIKSTADNAVLFNGIINDFQFVFNFSPDNIKENNTIECNLPGLSNQVFYPFHILKSTSEEWMCRYERMCESKSSCVSSDEYSQHTFNFENNSGDVLLTAKLRKETPKAWFETYGNIKRQRPPYDLRQNEKTQGTGYAENIYLDPIKQLIAASMKDNNDMQLTCSYRDWYYAIEDYMTTGKFTYPDGRMAIVKNTHESIYRYDRKLFRPGFIVRDYIEFGGKKIWYVADYDEIGNDEQIDATFIFESNYSKNALLKFEGSFIRQSEERVEKSPGKVRGYVTYYRIKGVISTIGKDSGEVSKSIDLYNNGLAIEKIAVSFSKPETFTENWLNNHRFSVNENITVVEPIGLNDLVGLKKVKQTFEEFKKFGEYRQSLSMNLNLPDNAGDMLLDIYKERTNLKNTSETSNDAIAFHMAFMGSPGTGKTTVAKRVASVLKEYGLVVSNEVPLIVVKSDLVGQYIGHTEKIVKRKIKEAMGSILFIDEACTLFNSDDGNDFGKIALNEIMYAMENHRDKIVVIFAGYTDEMLHMLRNANPGLTSRIPWHFYFEDYSAEEMWDILIKKVESNGFKFDDNTEVIKSKVLKCFAVLKREMDGVKEEGKTKHYFGNGRGVRTFFQYMQIGLAARLANKDPSADLRTFTLDEVDFAYSKFEKRIEKQNDEKAFKIGFSLS